MPFLNENAFDQGVGEVFDRFAEPDLDTDVYIERRDRAIALACMLAYNEGHYDWQGVLDSAMRQRGVESAFSSLTAKQAHVETHRAAGKIGELTKKCNSMSGIIVALCQD